MKGKNIELIVRLTLARLEIIKLKHTEAGYLWSMVNSDGKLLINQTLVEIDFLLKQLRDEQ